MQEARWWWVLNLRLKVLGMRGAGCWLRSEVLLRVGLLAVLGHPAVVLAADSAVVWQLPWGSAAELQSEALAEGVEGRE